MVLLDIDFDLVLRAVVVLLCLGGIWSVADSVEQVGAGSGWDGCVSHGAEFTRTCYVTWKVGEFDTGVPLVLSRTSSEYDIGVDTSGQSFSYWRVFRNESDVW